MSDASSSPKRPRLDLDENSKDEQYDKFKSREQGEESMNVSQSKSRKRTEPDDEDVKDEDSKSKSSNRDTTPREHTLVMRLANKEQELQECMNQIQEMKQAQTQKTAHLRSMLLDPAINLVFQRMAKEMEEHKEKLKQKQNELSAWKFTRDSQTGMRLISKCHMLLQENGDLGKMISSGRTSRLEGEIVLHKTLVTEMKKNQKELDEFVGELEEDVEGMQGMIFMLQEQLKEAREQIARLQQENEQLRTLRMPPDPEPGGGCSLPPSWSDPHSSGSTSAVNASSTPPPTLTSSSSSSGEYRTTSGATQSSTELPMCRVPDSKVTPDSGLPGQDSSMDTTDNNHESASPPSLHHPPVTSSDWTAPSGSKNSLRTNSDAKQEKSPCDVDGSSNALTPSSSPSSSPSPDSSCRTNWRTSSSAPPATLETAPSSCDSNNARTTTPPPSLNGKIEVHESGDAGREDNGRTHTADTCSVREATKVVDSAADAKDRTLAGGDEIEQCQQSLHSTAGLTLGGKFEEDSTTTDSAQTKEKLVNGMTNQDL